MTEPSGSEEGFGVGRASANLMLRAAEQLADIDNPYLTEERQRDVSNEAAAVALEVSMWFGLAVATVLLWTRPDIGVTVFVFCAVLYTVSTITYVFRTRHFGLRWSHPEMVSHWSHTRRVLNSVAIGLTMGGLWKATATVADSLEPYALPAIAVGAALGYLNLTGLAARATGPTRWATLLVAVSAAGMVLLGFLAGFAFGGAQ